ncbi:MAG TPA: PAS domain S-box protein, partial [Bacteroidales bacterium]|nr:PAS domain S-box protein [Bacteroidales bacterium]
MLYSELSQPTKLGDGAFFSGILNSLPQGVLLCSNNGHINFVNTRCIELFRIKSSDTAQRESLPEFIEAQTRSIVYDAILRLSELKTYKGEHIFNCCDGSSFAGELNLSLYSHEGLSYIVATIDNISEQKHAVLKLNEEFNKYRELAENMELALHDADERYKTVVSNAPIVLFEIDAKGIFRLSEGGALPKIGLKPGQVVGVSAFEVYKDYPEICNHIRRALGGEIVHDKINTNGAIFDIYYHPVLSRRKKITSLIGIAVEITDKDQTEQMLIESEEKFRTLFESMAEGVALHDLVFNEQGEPVNYRINEVNPSYKAHTGLDISKTAGKLATEIYGTENPPYFKEFSEVAITGKPFHYETYFPPLERFFRISVVSNGKNRFATVFEDITVDKNRERELKNKNEELEKFTYTVSHDLRSPLVTIKGFIGILQQDIAEGNIQSIADDIRRINLAADKMTDLLNDLLQLSQIGRIINPPDDVSMQQIVDDTIELLTGIINEREASIR